MTTYVATCSFVSEVPSRREKVGAELQYAGVIRRVPTRPAALGRFVAALWRRLRRGTSRAEVLVTTLSAGLVVRGASGPGRPGRRGCARGPMSSGPAGRPPNQQYLVNQSLISDDSGKP
jgi:hypothetical protein